MFLQITNKLYYKQLNAQNFTFLSGLAISGSILQKGLITSKNLTEKNQKIISSVISPSFMAHF